MEGCVHQDFDQHGPNESMHVNAGVSECVAMPPAVPIHCAAPAPSASDCVPFPPAMQLPTAMPDPQHKQKSFSEPSTS